MVDEPSHGKTALDESQSILNRCEPLNKVIRNVTIIVIFLYFILKTVTAGQQTTFNTPFKIINTKSSNSVSANSKYNWKLYNIKDGIATFLTKIEGTNLLGVRGVTIIDMHISEAMAPFVNMSMAYEWIDMLRNFQILDVDRSAKKMYSEQKLEQNTEQISRKNTTNDNIFGNIYKTLTRTFKRNKNLLSSNITVIEHTNPREVISGNSQDGKVPIDLIYQEIGLPWPIAPRDILLQREFHYDEPQSEQAEANGRCSCDINRTSGSVLVKYHSVDDARVPERPGFVRSQAPHILWRFSSVRPTEDICALLSDAGVNPHSQIATEDFPRIRSCEQFRHGQLQQQLLKSLPNLSAGNNIDSACVSQTNRYRTVLVVECVIDSKAGLPAWFINFIQQSWPHKTLGRYRKLTSKKKSAVFEKVQNWY